MTGSGRSNADAVLLAHLVAGNTFAATANAAGVSERTVRRRMKDPEFKRHPDEARVEVVRCAVNRAAASAVEAVETMIGLMRNGESGSVRLRAAKAVLDFVREQEGDPVSDAIRGVNTVSVGRLTEFLRHVVSTALDHMSDESGERFIDALAACQACSVKPTCELDVPRGGGTLSTLDPE